MSKTHHTNLGNIFVTKEKLAGKFFSETYFYLKYVCLRYCTCFDELVSTFGKGNTQDIQMSAQIGCWSHHVLPKWLAELTHCRLRFDSSKKSKKCPCFVKHPLLGGIAVQLCVLIPIPIRFAGAKSCHVLSHPQISKEMFSRPQMSNVSFPHFESTLYLWYKCP